MTQDDLFSVESVRAEKPVGDRPHGLRVLVTVKAAPNPSVEYGETVCVAGLLLDLNRRSWIRLYPINFRYLEDDRKFKKYDVVTVDAVPARADVRVESWRPRMDTLRVVHHLKNWRDRQAWIGSHIETSMCALHRNTFGNSQAPSLGLVQARQVLDMIVEPHPGWTPQEQAKIDAYVNQLDMLSSVDRTPLMAPRMRGWYRWRCDDSGCHMHRQSILDWEFVAFQRHLRHLNDDALRMRLRERFLDEMCSPDRGVAFYVGNQAKRHQTFSVLGVFWPPRT